MAVIGAGPIGMGVAWRLAQAGRRVTVFERDRAGRGAIWAAAGMLAPDAEIGFEELDLYRLGRESNARWPAFARELEAASGRPVGYDDAGTILAADDRDSAAALRRLFAFQQAHGARTTWLAPDDALDLEPLLSPRLPAAVWSPDDHQVDNRLVPDALAEAVLRAGGEIREQTPVAAVEPGDAPAVRLSDGTRVEARVVVLAAGAWSRHVGGLSPAAPVRPVAGQALALRVADDALRLRHVIRGPRAYLVPKAYRVVVGATSEERGDGAPVTAGGVYRLLDGAVRVVPAVEEWDWVETWTGLRPASPDHAPLLGDSPHAGVVYATGHYRHGMLLLPVTSDAVAALVSARLDGSEAVPDVLAPFSPRRLRDSGQWPVASGGPASDSTASSGVEDASSTGPFPLATGPHP